MLNQHFSYFSCWLKRFETFTLLTYLHPKVPSRKAKVNILHVDRDWLLTRTKIITDHFLSTSWGCGCLLASGRFKIRDRKKIGESIAVMVAEDFPSSCSRSLFPKLLQQFLFCFNRSFAKTFSSTRNSVLWLLGFVTFILSDLFALFTKNILQWTLFSSFKIV